MDQKKEDQSSKEPADAIIRRPPPPDLSPPPRPPESPLDGPSKPPQPPPLGGVAVNVRIKTGSETEDELPASGMAPFNSRAIAAVIDAVVMSGIVVGMDFLLPEILHRVSWLAGIAYVVTRDALPFLGGQSVGKKAMNLRAVTRDGRSLTGNWEASAIRNGVLIIPFFSLVELWILLTREDKSDRGLRLGDEWAKTKVIIEEKLEESKTEE